MKNKKTILISILIIILLFIFIYMYTYLNTYYRSDKEASKYLETNDIVTVAKEDNIYYFNGPGEDKSLIFYPGGKVEYTSYAPLLFNLAEKGIDCFLIKMPYNLAILDKNAANKVINKYNYQSWYIGGHSLGGVVASMYISDNDNIEGLILLASYPNKKINDNIKILSIYGTKDGILNLDKYKDNKKYWSKNTYEVTIEGGNHSQFGYYGFQKNDNKPTISQKEQQNKTIESIVEFTNK